MTVKRVVANIATEQMEAAKAFYGNLLGMSLGMNHGWIITFVGAANRRLSSASRWKAAPARLFLICRSRSMTFLPHMSASSPQDTRSNMARLTRSGALGASTSRSCRALVEHLGAPVNLGSGETMVKIVVEARLRSNNGTLSDVLNGVVWDKTDVRKPR